jgi:hypothetical protein
LTPTYYYVFVCKLLCIITTVSIRQAPRFVTGLDSATDQFTFDTYPGIGRVRLVEWQASADVTVMGVTLSDATHFTSHFLNCARF